jgi:hypothetical protein
MKNMTTKITLFIAAAALCITINACKKSSTLDTDITAAQDNSQAENESNFIGNAADAGAATETPQPRSNGTGWQIFQCATVTITDTSQAQKTMTITFNPNNGTCRSLDGKLRTGQIIVIWTGRYRDSGTVIQTTTNNYTVDGYSYNFKRTVTNAGTELYNGARVPYFTISENATIATSTGTISWTSSRTREWIAGSNYPLLWWLTEYSITGSASGTDRKGEAFTVTITNPIIANLGCYWLLVQGTFDLQIQGKAERTIDFGQGTCDDAATCTINGVVYNFQFGNY